MTRNACAQERRRLGDRTSRFFCTQKRKNTLFIPETLHFSAKNRKKLKKNKKKCEKICIYQKKAVILHRHLLITTKRNRKMNTKNNTKMSTTFINRNFRIKVAGLVEGQKVNKLVGVSGLKAILNSEEKMNKFLERALSCGLDKCCCKIYGGAKVTFYAK